MINIIILVICALLSSCVSYESEHNRDLSKKTLGTYKIGNAYKINGKIYHPKKEINYDQEGLASWYGSEFHNRKTANGAIFSKNQLTAAHKTLPLPSVVEVTNLSNGRKIELVVNDRGPYGPHADKRIIDLSERAAELLGMRKQGVGKVRVRYLHEHSETLLAGNNPFNRSSEQVQVAQVNQKVAIAEVEDKEANQKIEKISSYPVFVQVASFSDLKNAKTFSKGLLTQLKNRQKAKLHLLEDDGTFKLKFGPINDKSGLENLIRYLYDVNHRDFMIVKSD